MKKLMTCIAAGLLVVGAQTLLAQASADSTAPATVPAATPGTHHNGMTAEQRKQFMKAIGLTKEDLKDLSAQERKDKIKEAAQKALADLKAKQSAGTLTEQQQSDLTLLQKFMAHTHKKSE